MYVDYYLPVTSVTQYPLACSKRSDSGERCGVKKAMKSRGGLGREVRSFLLHTAPHYLNAWNRLNTLLKRKIDRPPFLLRGGVCTQAKD